MRKLHDLSWHLMEGDIKFDFEQIDSNDFDMPLLLIWHKDEVISKAILCSSKDYSEKIPNLEAIPCSSEYDSKKFKYYLQTDANGVGEIFSLLLVLGRPLEYYDCTFFLPLDLFIDEEIKQKNIKPNFNIRQDNSILERYKINPSNIIDKNKGDVIVDDDTFHTQAYEFFHSHIDDKIFETKKSAKDIKKSAKDKDIKKSIAHYRIKPNIIEDWTLKVEIPDTKEDIIANIKDVSMYEYYNGMLLLGIRLVSPDVYPDCDFTNFCSIDLNIKKEKYSENYHQEYLDKNIYKDLYKDLNKGPHKSWWHKIIFRSIDDSIFEKLERLQVKYWLKYTKLARILYANFYEQVSEKKIANLKLNCSGKEITSEKNDKFSRIITHLIEQFIEPLSAEFTRTSRLGQVSDERMFSHVGYALFGDMPKKDTPAYNNFERLFSYALYVDEASDGYPSADNWCYDKTFTKQLMESNISRRWQSTGSLSGYTDYSTVFMGLGDFVKTPLLSLNLPYIYGKMQILILFYKLTLRNFNRRIVFATDDLVNNKSEGENIKALHKSLIEFNNEHWFRELTPQIQGKEITEAMIKQQELADDYALVKDKLSRADDYLTSVHNITLQKTANNLAHWAIGFGLMFFAVEFLPEILVQYIDLCSYDMANKMGEINFLRMWIFSIVLIPFGIWIYKWRRKQ